MENHNETIDAKVREDRRRTNLWRCPKCGHWQGITTGITRFYGRHRLREGDGYRHVNRTFQGKCQSCGKYTRLASRMFRHIFASFPVSKRAKATRCIQLLRMHGNPDVNRRQLFDLCGKKAVEKAEDYYAQGGEQE